jgi:hypothetical protein
MQETTLCLGCQSSSINASVFGHFLRIFIGDSQMVSEAISALSLPQSMTIERHGDDYIDNRFYCDK